MFWNKKTEPPEPEPKSVVQTVTTEIDETLESKSKKLIASLKDYSESAYKDAISKPDSELIEAREKVAKANMLIVESRLGYALGRCIPEHIKYWASWIDRDDFEDWVRFDASNISAIKSEEKTASKKVSTSTIEFKFNNLEYRIVFSDEGISYIFDSTTHYGSIELWFNGKRVAKFSLDQDVEQEFSQWEYSSVKALKVGPWMKDILDIAAQIQAREKESLNSYADKNTLETAKNIEL